MLDSKEVESVLSIVRLLVGAAISSKNTTKIESLKQEIDFLVVMIEYMELSPSVQSIITKEVADTYSTLSRATTNRLTSIISQNQ